MQCKYDSWVEEGQAASDIAISPNGRPVSAACVGDAVSIAKY